MLKIGNRLYSDEGLPLTREILLSKNSTTQYVGLWSQLIFDNIMLTISQNNRTGNWNLSGFFSSSSDLPVTEEFNITENLVGNNVQGRVINSPDEGALLAWSNTQTGQYELTGLRLSKETIEGLFPPPPSSPPAAPPMSPPIPTQAPAASPVPVPSPVPSPPVDAPDGSSSSSVITGPQETTLGSSAATLGTSSVLSGYFPESGMPFTSSPSSRTPLSTYLTYGGIGLASLLVIGGVTYFVQKKRKGILSSPARSAEASDIKLRPWNLGGSNTNEHYGQLPDAPRNSVYKVMEDGPQEQPTVTYGSLNSLNPEYRAIGREDHYNSTAAVNQRNRSALPPSIYETPPENQ